MNATDFIYMSVCSGALRNGVRTDIANKHADIAVEQYKRNIYSSIESLINDAIKSAGKEYGKPTA